MDGKRPSRQLSLGSLLNSSSISEAMLQVAVLLPTGAVQHLDPALWCFSLPWHMRRVSTGNLSAAIPVPGPRKLVPSALATWKRAETQGPPSEPMHSIYASDLQFLDKGSWEKHLYSVQSDNPVLTGTDYPPRRLGHLFIPGKVSIKCCLSNLVVVPSPPHHILMETLPTALAHTVLIAEH